MQLKDLADFIVDLLLLLPDEVRELELEPELTGLDVDQLIVVGPG